MPLSALWPQISQVVRDTILGPRGTEPGSEGRKGRFFSENGMLVTEVEILEAEIQDNVIADLMKNVQRESVMLAIGDRQAQEKVASAKLRSDLERQQTELQMAGKQREAQLGELVRKLKHEAELANLRERELVQGEQVRLTGEREIAELRGKVEREGLSLNASLEALSRDAATKAGAAAILHAEEIEHISRVRALEIQLLEAQARAVVAERTSVQPQLVEALTALGDKNLLSEVAHNMNLVSLFRGKEAGEILKDVVGGSRFLPALNEALASKPSPAKPEPPVAPSPVRK